MKRQDVLSVLITFTAGFIGGAFLYLVHFAELVAPLSNVPSQSATEKFEIISEAYGGCRDACPAFQLSADGSYRLEYYEGEFRTRSFKEGTIPRELLKDVQNALKDEDALFEQSEEYEPRECNSYSDGIDLKYQITLQGDEYIIDSCGTRVDGDGAIWNSLAKIWEYFKTVE